MKQKLFICIVILATGNLFAGALDITEGYGKTKWGQSGDDVKQEFPGLSETEASGTIKEYEATADAPVSSLRFMFVADQLFMVTAQYELAGKPEKGIDEDGLEFVKDLVDKKYHSDDEIKKELKKNGIRISVYPKPDGTINVSYENNTVYTKVQQLLAEQKRQAAIEAKEARKGSERFEKVKESGIEDTL